MLKRSKEQLIAQILEICLQAESSKTRIVYQANLNFNTVNPYLDLLIGRGLLEVTSGQYPSYRTTQRGQNVLKRLRVIEEIMVS